MALAKIQKTIFKVNSNTIPAAGHTYSIQVSGGGSAIPIYSNSSGTVPIDNPGTLPSNGLLSFFVRSGTCRIKVTDPITLEEQIWDNEPCISPDVLSSAKATLQFATLADLINCNPINKGEIIDPADYVGQKVSTIVNNTTSNKGGAEYTIWTLAAYRAAISNLTWVPDGYVHHYLLGGTTYVAIFSRGEISTSQAGGGEAAWLAIQSQEQFSRVVVDSDVNITDHRTSSKTLEFRGGTFNGAFTLTVVCAINAYRDNVFGDTINVVTASGYPLDFCYPEWFKLASDTDYTDAFQKSFNFLIPVGGHVSCRPNFSYTYSGGITCVLTDYSITIGGDSLREQAKFTHTGNGVGIWFRSGGDLFANGRVINAEVTGPDLTAGNETAIGFRFSDGWGHGCVGVTQRGFDTSTFIQFYNYDRWTEGWVVEDVVCRRALTLIDFERDDGVSRTNTDSFGWGNIIRCNFSTGNGGLGYGTATALDISSVKKGGSSAGDAGANVYGINIESLVLFSEVSGNVRFFNVRNDGNILTGQADISIDGFINQTSADHQVLYQRDGGYINLQGRFIHQQGSAVRPADQWRALCFTEPVNSLPDRRSPCNYIGAVVRIGGTVTTTTNGTFTYQLNAGCVYSVKLTAKGDNSFINADYRVTTYSGDLISDVTLASGFETANIKLRTFSGLANHAFSIGNGGKIDVLLDCTAGPEDIVWHMDIEQILG